jgi:CBS domain containing-hemolysin-like protein
MFVWNFLLILLLIALNAFFVSVEYAVVASRKARIEILAEEGNAAARVVKGWIDSPPKRDRLIAASQIGITMVGLALGAIGENTFQGLLSPIFDTLVLPENFSSHPVINARR